MMPARMLGAVVWAALSAVLVRTGAICSRAAPSVRDPLIPTPTPSSTGPVVLRAVVDPPARGGQIHVLRRRPRSVRRSDGPPFECEWDAGRRSSSSRSGSWRPRRRRPPRPDRADPGPRRHRKGRRRDRPGHGHGDRRSRRVRRRAAAERVSRVRGRQAADDHLLFVGRRPAGAGRRRGHQRQHGDGDAEAQAGGQGVPRRGAGRESRSRCSGSTTRSSRSRGSRPILRKSGCKAVDRLAPWGATALYDVIVRGIDMLGAQTGRKALVVFSDGEDQGSHVDARPGGAAAAGERRDAVHDRPGPRLSVDA